MFGTRAGAFPEAGNNGEVFIRTFKDPSTTIRIAPDSWYDEAKKKEVTGTEAFFKELEHFDRNGFRRSFPCPVPHGFKRDDCPGCTHPDEEVRKRSAKWYFNALDEKGYLRVFKIGIKILKKFQFRENRLGSIYGRDWEIVRDGKEWNEIEYELEAGDKDERKFPEKLHDIPSILSRQWKEALAYYNGQAERSAAESAENDREEDAPVRTEAAAEPDFEQRRPDISGRAEEPAASNGNGQGGHSDEDEVKTILAEWGTNPSEEKIKRANTNVIKAFLDAEPAVEYPARAPRSRLVTMAVEKADAPPY